MFQINPRHAADIASLRRPEPITQAKHREISRRMHPADIKAALEKSGSSQVKIARQLGVSRTTIAHVVHGRSKSRRIAHAISQATGIPVAELWPGKYENVQSRYV